MLILNQGNHRCPRQEAGLEAPPRPRQVRATSTEYLLASRLKTWNQGLTQASNPLAAKICCQSLRRGSMQWSRWGLGADSISYHVYELSHCSAVWEIHLSFIVKTRRSLSDISLTSSRVCEQPLSLWISRYEPHRFYLSLHIYVNTLRL